MDDFTPAGQTTTMVPAAPENEELKANIELAKAASDPRFMLIVQKSVGWVGQRAGSPEVITTSEQYGQATALVKDMKGALSDLEEVRQTYVAFPTKVINMTNSLFRQTKQAIEGQREFLRKMIARRDDELEKERQAELVKAAELNKPPKVEEKSDGVGVVQFAEVPGVPGLNAVDSTKGAVDAKVPKVDFNIEIENLHEFLGVLVSRAMTNVWITDHLENIVRIDFEALKDVLRENPKKRKVKGLRISKV